LNSTATCLNLIFCEAVPTLRTWTTSKWIF